jgi:hypothetical protein
MTHVRDLPAILAVPAVIDHQHPAAMRRGRRIGSQQFQPTAIDLLRVPPGLGEEELQALHRRVLGPGHRLGPGQQGRRLSPTAPTSESVIVSIRVQMLTFRNQCAIVALILPPRLPGIEP